MNNYFYISRRTNLSSTSDTLKRPIFHPNMLLNNNKPKILSIKWHQSKKTVLLISKVYISKTYQDEFSKNYQTAY